MQNARIESRVGHITHWLLWKVGRLKVTQIFQLPVKIAVIDPVEAPIAAVFYLHAVDPNLPRSDQKRHGLKINLAQRSHGCVAR